MDISRRVCPPLVLRHCGFAATVIVPANDLNPSERNRARAEGGPEGSYKPRVTIFMREADRDASYEGRHAPRDETPRNNVGIVPSFHSPFTRKRDQPPDEIVLHEEAARG